MISTNLIVISIVFFTNFEIFYFVYNHFKMKFFRHYYLLVNIIRIFLLLFTNSVMNKFICIGDFLKLLIFEITAQINFLIHFKIFFKIFILFFLLFIFNDFFLWFWIRFHYIFLLFLLNFNKFLIIRQCLLY